MKRKHIIGIYVGILTAVILLATEWLSLDLGKSIFIVLITVLIGSTLMEKLIK
ncbi:hypothetical protein [Leuconostoc pseudomesenteroides]|uniref:hypothetical protein n=1 Tax=Leuconostoc pseudomesenteroides TaxID=33968 RepID=UPI00166EE567|nr:hypothetical protein [Leuconostoc pseudomesenteroides]